MTFKIDRLVGGENSVVLRTCGRMDIECVNTLKDLTEAESFEIILDLSEVTLADRDAAMFLAICELKGTELKNSSAFLRDWVAKERARTLRRSIADAVLHRCSIRRNDQRLLQMRRKQMGEQMMETYKAPEKESRVTKSSQRYQAPFATWHPWSSSSSPEPKPSFTQGESATANAGAVLSRMMKPAWP